jgi:hypothetical protein
MTTVEMMTDQLDTIRARCKSGLSAEDAIDFVDWLLDIVPGLIDELTTARRELAELKRTSV